MSDTLLLLAIAKRRLRKMTGEELNRIPQEFVDLIVNIDEILCSNAEILSKKQFLEAETDGRIH